MPRRRDRVAPPPRPGGWDIRFGEGDGVERATGRTASIARGATTSGQLAGALSGAESGYRGHLDAVWAAVGGADGGYDQQPGKVAGTARCDLAAQSQQ